MLGDQTVQARETKHLALRIMGLYKAITIEYQSRTRHQLDLILLIRHPSHCAQWQPGTMHIPYRASLTLQRRHMAGIRKIQSAADWIEHGVQARDEHG
jgi:hypothetical protein